MHAHSSYNIEMYGDETDISKLIKTVINPKLGDNYADNESIIAVQETYQVVFLEDIRELAKEMVKAASAVMFCITGTVDCT